jgi:hypothetical protein
LLKFEELSVREDKKLFEVPLVDRNLKRISVLALS